MTGPVNCVHHVVWCVRPENLERVRALWQDALGLELVDVDLPDLGLRVLISWEGGVEIMSPVHDRGTLADSAREFLRTRGEGVYSVVFNVAELDGAVAAVAAQGGSLVFQETIAADELDDRQIVAEDPPERYAVKQALFDDLHGFRLCLQQLIGE